MKGKMGGQGGVSIVSVWRALPRGKDACDPRTAFAEEHSLGRFGGAKGCLQQGADEFRDPPPKNRTTSHPTEHRNLQHTNRGSG